MSNLKDLLAQKAALEAEIAEAQTRERSAAISQVRELMAAYGLTVGDLASTRIKTAKLSKVAAKYRNEATGETWSGRGLQPKWLKNAIAQGAKLTDFSV